MATTKLLTVEEYDLIPDDGRLWELIDGETVEKKPTGGRISEVGGAVLGSFRNHEVPRQVAKVNGADGGFLRQRNPDRVRSPDVAFVAAERLPPPEEREGTLRLAPDLAVEVVSPWDRMPEVRAKVQEYLAARTRLVWVVEPRRRTITVHAADGTVRELGEGDVLDGGDVLPGFRLPVADIFAE